MWVYVEGKDNLFTVGFNSAGGYCPVHNELSGEDAASMVHFLNGGNDVQLRRIAAVLAEFSINTGKGLKEINLNLAKIAETL